jgi:hypothetical protein
MGVGGPDWASKSHAAKPPAADTVGPEFGLDLPKWTCVSYLYNIHPAGGGVPNQFCTILEFWACFGIFDIFLYWQGPLGTFAKQPRDETAKLPINQNASTNKSRFIGFQ